MRIYAVADIHARPERIVKIRENIARYRPDVLVIAGDITAWFHPARVLARLNRLGLPVLIIRGNTDLKRVEKLAGFYDNLCSLHLNQKQVKGISFAGLSGTIPIPFRSRAGMREKSLLAKTGQLIGRNSVLVVHPPPHGVLDQVMGKYNAGSKGIYRLVEQKQPRLVLCGHIHEAFGCVRLADSWIVNCNMAGHRQGSIVDIEAHGNPEIRMLEAG
ncbi:MAG: metallophosphoesterase family protein [Desulfobacterales bacterium]|nr:metallophosphoesterase family protein [Desulfobacterales bacterium]